MWLNHDKSVHEISPPSRSVGRSRNDNKVRFSGISFCVWRMRDPSPVAQDDKKTASG